MPVNRRISLSLTLFAALFSGCGGSQLQQAGDDPSMPELNDEVIAERINDTRVYDVPPENGTGNKIPWGFDEDEPKEIVVVDKQMNGTHATIVLDIKTQSSPRSNNLRYLYGQIRTEWELEKGFATRRWEIVRTENISMKYKDLPKPTPTPTPAKNG